MMSSPRTTFLTTAFFALLLLAVGCATQEVPQTSVEPPEPTMSVEPTEPAPPPPPLEPARYELTFEATWSSATHPTDFPSNPHFSGLIGATHPPETIVWSDGTLATPGVKNMAETGGKTPLDTEIEAMIAAGAACDLISGDGVNPSPGTATVSFGVSEECPLVSVVTMIAPSPDWFVGVSGLDLREDDSWADRVVVELNPWDAGTDSGASYASGNAPTDPAETIFLMPAAPPIAVDGDIPPFGTFTFELVDA